MRAIKAGILGEVTQITIETDEKDPTPVAIITDRSVDITEGFRVRVKPIATQENNNEV